MPGWMKNKSESKLPGEISITSDTQMTPPLWQKVKRTQKPLDKNEKGEWKSWLKLNIQKMKIMAFCPITSWQIDEETMETVTDFIFGGLQTHCRWWLQPWNSKMRAPWKKSSDHPRQYIKNHRHYFIDKGPYSESYGFSSSHIDGRVGPQRRLSHEEWMLSNCGAGKRLLRVPWITRRSS